MIFGVDRPREQSGCSRLRHSTILPRIFRRSFGVHAELESHSEFKRSKGTREDRTTIFGYSRIASQHPLDPQRGVASKVFEESKGAFSRLRRA